MLATSALAFAQPGGPPPPPPQPRGAYPGGYGPPPPPQAYAPGGFFSRRGLTMGLSLGAGGMGSDTGAIECQDCQGDPLAGSFSFHIGAMLNPRLALVFEAWLTTKALDSVGFTRVDQSMAMIAGQYWVTPRAWLKGGIGFSHLSLSYDDGFAVADEPVADGGALMGAAGYEVMAAPNFSVDVQLRLGVGTYEGVGWSDQIQSGIIGVGINWF